MSLDLISDLLTRVRNAQKVGHATVDVKSSKMVERVLSVMKNEGFIGEYNKTNKASDKKLSKIAAENIFTVNLRYYNNGTPAITTAKRMSKSGKRMYVESDSLPKIKSGLGISILSTSIGVISDKEARKNKVGGELVAIIS